MSESQRHFTIFCATLGGLILSAVVAVSLLLHDYRRDVFDFRQLTEDTLVGLPVTTRQQKAGVKVGYAERLPAPRIGMFGNHQVCFADTRALATSTPIRQRSGGDPLEYFNYFFANMTIIDVYHYMVHLNSLGQLPTETIIVGITTPNNDNGLYIVGRSRDMPVDISSSSDTGNLLPRIASGYHIFMSLLQYRMDYGSILTPLLRKGPHIAIVQRGKMGEHAHVKNSYRFDGSIVYKARGRELRLNENPLEPSLIALKAGDEVTIAKYLKRIDALGRQRGATVVFLIPPVYESDRQSTVNSIFTRALALTPEVNVIDHRRAYRDAKYFHHYDHANSRYYEVVFKELVSRGLLGMRRATIGPLSADAPQPCDLLARSSWDARRGGAIASGSVRIAEPRPHMCLPSGRCVLSWIADGLVA